jgi:phage portal protein BeeE
LASNLTKALRALRGRPQGEARGTVSGYTLGVSSLWGQPYPEQVSQDASGLISRQRMREIVLRTPTAAACMNAILDFAGGVKMDIRNVDPSTTVPKGEAKRIRAIFQRPNPDQTQRQFMLTLMRDIITFGYAAVEMVETGDDTHPVNLWVVDSARLRIDFDEHGFIRGYDMVDARGAPIINKPNGSSMYEFPQGPGIGTPSMEVPPSYTNSSVDSNSAPGTDLHGWEPEEVIFFSLNPISESVYPHSRIVQLFTAAVLEDLMMQFIAERFTDSNIPFGVFDLGDVTETELRLAIDNWNAQGSTGNRIIMTGSKGAGSKWMPFGYHLKDLEAVNLLAEFRMKIMGIMGVTMQELGESQDVNRSNGYNLSFTFKKRALEPLLDEITETFTKRLLWDRLGYNDAEYFYEEIDSRDDFLMSQIDTNYMKLGIMKPNEIRNRKGLTNIPGGDESIISTGNSWIPVDMLREMAEEVIKVEQASTAVGLSGPEGSSSIRVRSNAPDTGASPESGQSSNGHKRGASSEMARKLGSSPGQ